MVLSIGAGIFQARPRPRQHAHGIAEARDDDGLAIRHHDIG